MTLGEKIRGLRKQANMKQSELADKLGVARTAISNWESDINKPNVDLIANMCYLFNVSPNYFFEVDLPETKESPEPDATDSEDEKEKDEIVKVLTEGLSRLGFLDKDGMISDRDFKFLCSLVDLMFAHFDQED